MHGSENFYLDQQSQLLDGADALTKYLYLLNREVNAGKQSPRVPAGNILKPNGCIYCRLVYFSATAHTVLITNIYIALAHNNKQ